MELRREILLTISALVLLNLILAFGAIGLFVRMGPAIERILKENVASLAAAETILSELAQAGGAPLDAQAQVRVHQALQRAKRNLTEDTERPILADLEGQLPQAIAGNARRRVEAVRSLRALIQINRSAMRKEDSEAKRLGSAGAWAAVFVGFLSFLLSIVITVRLLSRFVRPLVDLYQVLEKVRQGDRLRRCTPGEAPHEVLQVMRSVNRLLDERIEKRTGG